MARRKKTAARRNEWRWKLREALCSVILLAICAGCAWMGIVSRNTFAEKVEETAAEGAEQQMIRWVDFDVTCEAMQAAYRYDRDSHGSETKLDWVELLAALGTKYGGDFSKYRAADLNALVKRLQNGESMAEIQAGNKYYAYYEEAYRAVLGEFVGEYEIRLPDENGELQWQTKYGLKVFSPIAEGYYYDHYDDFGAERTYGYARPHLGHDLLASVGTPIVAVESGVVEELGWNPYGGWRVGIRSLDGKRYYYYAHMRQNRPYHPDVAVGAVIRAGSVIGYVGRTGYSTEENENNVTVNHLHWGIQLIFDESQKDGTNEIWIDLYELTKFLQSTRSTVYRVENTKEYYRKYDFWEENLTKVLQQRPVGG